MGRKTDVGVLSILATMDTSQFTKALKDTGQRTKAWTVKLKGSINSISSSFTELNSKLSFMSQAFAMVGAGVTSSAQAWQFALDGSAASAEKLQATLERLPFGFGEVARWAKEAILALGLFRVEVEQLTKAEQQRADLSAAQMKRTQDANTYREETQKLRDKLEALQKSAVLTPKELIADKLSQEIAAISIDKARAALAAAQAKELDKKAIMDVSLYSDDRDAWADASRQTLVAQRELDALLEREKVLRAIAAAETEAITKRQIEKQAAEALTATEKMRAELAKETAKQLAAQEKLQKSLASQEKKVAEARAAYGQVGSTETINTAIGSIKVADEGRTRAIQERQLEKLNEQVKVLQDIKREMSGGALV